jgi:hypothetical protein
MRDAVARLRYAGETLKPSYQNQQLRFEVREQCNDRWNDRDRGYTITAERRELIQQSDSVFAMGSCFAREITTELERKGKTVYPAYDALEYDAERLFIGEHAGSRMLIHYDTFAIRQEFETAFGELKLSPDEIYEKNSKSASPFAVDRYHFDPCRKHVCGISRDDAVEAREIAERCVADGIHSADTYILTLGLIECWRNKKTGHYAWGVSAGRKSSLADDLEFHLASFEENCANVRRICELVRNAYPEKRIILTVSPVPLLKTFTDQDIVVANSESKCQLRAVVGQICREYGNVLYWPSYEIATRQDIYCEDGRHVSRDGVKFILDNFFKVYGQDAA